MNIYFSGIGGVGIGPLAEIAHDAGHTIFGSDIEKSLTTQELHTLGIEVRFNQDGSFVETAHQQAPLDWFVYTAALPHNHPELETARRLGIRSGKRDEFLAYFLKEHHLKLLAVSGTHGKTTTTGMLIWALQQLQIPVSYSIGTTMTFGPSGKFTPHSKYFIYECDEYDKNLLHFSPYLSLLTSIDYDHPDTYPTIPEYKETFRQFIAQSAHTIAWHDDLTYLNQPLTSSVWSLENTDILPFHIAGQHNRRNATLVVKALEYLNIGKAEQNIHILESFPGTDRRFEKLADNLYSDYGHHPEEIKATLQLASELSDDIVLVYQPHQNWRQYYIRDNYTDQFEATHDIYWLPTYLTRENDNQVVLTPEELTTHLTNKSSLHYATLNDNLWDVIQTARNNGRLVLVMGAGTIDGWVREQLKKSTN